MSEPMPAVLSPWWLPNLHRTVTASAFTTGAEAVCFYARGRKVAMDSRAALCSDDRDGFFGRYRRPDLDVVELSGTRIGTHKNPPVFLRLSLMSGVAARNSQSANDGGEGATIPVIGGSAHAPSRRCAEPSQVAALVDTDRPGSTMAAMWPRRYSSDATVSNYRSRNRKPVR